MRSVKKLANVRPRAMLPVLFLLLAIAVKTSALARLQDEAAPSLTGTYTTSIGREDVPGALAGGEALVGRWTLELGDAGTYSLARQDVGEVASGSFAAGPATLAFEGWSGVVGCDASGHDGSMATYAWQLSDDLLTLTPIDDLCPERLTLLTTRPLLQVDACEEAPVAQDPFSMIEAFGTPVAEGPAVTGVAAQEGFGEGLEAERAIDSLLRSANGCWAAAEPDLFMALHSQGLTGQIAIMGPVDAFIRELRAFMEAPLTLERVGDVTLEDSSHAWAYVEITLNGQPNPQRMNFVLERGIWKLDTFFLFGPPIQGPPLGPLP